MKPNLIPTCCAALLLLAFTACSTKTDANNTNFTAAMNTYLDQRGDLCLAKDTWPIDVTPHEVAAGGRNALQMPVLEKLGLVASTVATVEQNDDGQVSKIQVHRYDLTDAGKKYYLTRELRSQASDGSTRIRHGDLCPARLSLDKVVSWDAPTTGGANRETVVHFTYKIAAAPWTADADVQKVFPMLDRIVRGAGTAQLQEAVVLTPEGWVAKDL